MVVFGETNEQKLSSSNCVHYSVPLLHVLHAVGQMTSRVSQAGPTDPLFSLMRTRMPVRRSHSVQLLLCPAFLVGNKGIMLPWVRAVSAAAFKAGGSPSLLCAGCSVVLGRNRAGPWNT